MNLARAAGVLWTALVLLFTTAAWAIKIHVRGSAVIDGAVHAEQEGFLVRGELADDAGIPITGAIVRVALLSADAPHRQVALPPPLSCDGGQSRALGRPTPDEYTVQTDDRGAFCVRSAVPAGGGKVRVRFAGTSVYEPVETTFDATDSDARLARTVLRFEPPPDVIDLDKETALVTASLRIERSEAGRLPVSAPSRREGLSLSLEDERGRRIGEATTGGDGRARFEVRTADLAPPGPGELRLRFAGSGALAKSAASQPVARRMTVGLSLAHPIEGGDPEAGIPIDVDVNSGRGPASDGVVEATRSGERVGAATVADGHAHVIVAFATDRRGTVPLVLRYLPSSPWWRAGAALQVEARVAGPGVGKQLILAILVLGIAGWVIAGWRRAPKPALRTDLETGTSPPSGRAGVQVLSSGGQSGWRGHVMDAHDASPIAGAHLRIVVPAFQGDGVVAEAVTDERGAFTLEAPARPAHHGLGSDARLVVDAKLHSSHEQAVPPPSVLAVALVTRRRALLERLVRWARRHGAPFDGPPEPTPGHVRRTAARVEAAEVEAWARRVEHAAFGPDHVDEQLEDEVRTAEPHAVRPNTEKRS